MSKMLITLVLILALGVAFPDTTHSPTDLKFYSYELLKNHKPKEEQEVKTTSVSKTEKNQLEEKMERRGKEIASRSTSRDYKTLRVVSTAYIAFCDTGCIGITRTGYDVSKTIYYRGMEIIAVDPKVIPLNSIVEYTIDGKTHRAIALDTGGAIKGHKIDRLVKTKKEAYAWGKREIELKVYSVR
jgi:3D (Asp-Asp-Asp) domain-containing protein